MNTAITITNAAFSATVALKGAELKSLVRLADGKEFIWQGDPKYWEDSAPMLFPICGRLNGGRYTLEGKTYELPIHGFLPTLMPAETRCGEGELVLIFRDTAETYAQYPFHFELTVQYMLSDRGIACRMTVANRDERTMYYSIGAHPGFSVPLTEGATLEDHYLRFPEAGTTHTAVINDDGLFTGELPPYALAENKEIRLSEEQFRIDGIFLNGVGGVTELHCDGAADFIRVTCPMVDLTGTWKEYGEAAKFLCLEPWCGYPSVAGVPDALDKKLGMYALEPSAEGLFTFDIEICPEG